VFKKKTSYEISLQESCPQGFPKKTFKALKDIIRGTGQDCSADDYKALFCIEEQVIESIEIPSDVAEKYNISSKNQKFLTSFMINQLDPKKPKSKDAIIRDALKRASLPAGKEALKKLKPVFSQLKSKGVIEYYGKAGKKAVLKNNFLEDLHL